MRSPEFGICFQVFKFLTWWSISTSFLGNSVWGAHFETCMSNNLYVKAFSLPLFSINLTNEMSWGKILNTLRILKTPYTFLASYFWDVLSIPVWFLILLAYVQAHIHALFLSCLNTFVSCLDPRYFKIVWFYILIWLPSIWY